MVTDLKLLHTDPKHQRRGAGGLLIEKILEETGELGLTTYLQATPDGRGLYERKGFKVIDTITYDFSKWGGTNGHEVYIMAHDP